VSRIRSIKPEWLDDEEIVLRGSDARVLSIAAIILADDYGNGRANRQLLRSRVFPVSDQSILDSALSELVSARFLELYEIDGQSYFHIRNWERHQRVDKPGKPRVPGPPSTSRKIRGVSKKLPYVSANVLGTPAPDQEHRSIGSDQEHRSVGADDPDETDTHPDAEDGTQPLPDADSMPTPRFFWLEFCKRYAEARAGDKPGTNDKHVSNLDKVAAFLDERSTNGVELSRVTKRLLDGFFADPWAKSVCYPLTALASGMDKYFNPPEPVTQTRLRAGRVIPSGGTTEKDFEDVPSVEEQLARYGIGTR
jgi:hypothetical protein